MLQNAAFTYDDYVDFLTTYLSLVHVITPDDLVGTTTNPDSSLTFFVYNFCYRYILIDIYKKTALQLVEIKKIY